MTIHIPGTNQEIFDRVCAHLAQQGTRAQAGGGCKYRAEDGRRCAIGVLLADEDCATLDALDDSQILGILRRGIATADADENLLSDLQSAHDLQINATVLRNTLISVAFQYNLKPDAAEQIEQWLV